MKTKSHSNARILPLLLLLVTILTFTTASLHPSGTKPHIKVYPTFSAIFPQSNGITRSPPQHQDAFIVTESHIYRIPEDRVFMMAHGAASPTFDELHHLPFQSEPHKHQFLSTHLMQLPLPNYNHFNSTQGQEILSQFLVNASPSQKQQFLRLLMQFETQDTQTWCSLASFANVFHSLLHLQKPVSLQYSPYSFTTQKALYENQNMQQEADCVQAVVPLQDVTTMGATLEQLYRIMKCYMSSSPGNQTASHYSFECHHAEDSTPEQWKEHMTHSLSHGSLIIINYSRVHLSQMGGGHFSVLSMWDEASQTALLMDTARYKYPFAFVPSDDLFHAMNTTDLMASKSRGWITISPK